MELLWQEEPELLEATSRRRFRDTRDVSQYLFRYWQYATNQFSAEKIDRVGKYYEIKDTNDAICQAIREQRYAQVCLNDADLVSSKEVIQRAREDLIAAFESIFPNPCQYEKKSR